MSTASDVVLASFFLRMSSRTSSVCFDTETDSLLRIRGNRLTSGVRLLSFPPNELIYGVRTITPPLFLYLLVQPIDVVLFQREGITLLIIAHENPRCVRLERCVYINIIFKCLILFHNIRCIEIDENVRHSTGNVRHDLRYIVVTMVTPCTTRPTKCTTCPTTFTLLIRVSDTLKKCRTLAGYVCAFCAGVSDDEKEAWWATLEVWWATRKKSDDTPFAETHAIN